MPGNQASTRIASSQQPDRTTTSGPSEDSRNRKRQKDPEQGLLEAGGDDVTGRWPHKQVLLLTELHREHHYEMLHCNEHKHKKTAWQMIAAAMNAPGYTTVTWALCDKKLRNLKIRYRSILDHHHKSCRGRK